MIRRLRQSLKWVVHHHFGKPVVVNGHPVKLPRGLLGPFTLVRPNGYEEDVCKILAHWLRPGDVFVDVGANIGMLSLYAARIVGAGGRVISCEPNPYSALNLVELLRANGMLDRLTLLPLAIGGGPDIVPLSISTFAAPTMGRSSIIHKDPGAVALNVATGRLDDWADKLPGVRLLKIDVEGAELGVLKGARRMLSQFRPTVCLEIHGIYFDRPADLVTPVFEYFEGLEYGVWNLLTGRRQLAAEFLKDTGYPGSDPLSGRAFREAGYGQLLCAPLSEAEGVEAFLRKGGVG